MHSGQKQEIKVLCTVVKEKIYDSMQEKMQEVQTGYTNINNDHNGGTGANTRTTFHTFMYGHRPND